MTARTRTAWLAVFAAAFLALAALVAARNPIILDIDAHAAAAAAALRTPVLDRIMLFLTRTGDPYQALAIFAVAALFLAERRRMHDAYLFVIATGIGAALVEIAKVAIARPRPPVTLLVEPGFSFPSWHAMISTVFLLAALLLVAPAVRNRFARAAVRIAAIILFPLVAASRIYLSVHFASDIAGGILAGFFAYGAAALIIRHHRSAIARQ